MGNSPIKKICPWVLPGGMVRLGIDIYIKYLKNILISRLYEQFSPNDSKMAPEKNFKLLKYEHITYSFEARDLEISNI